MITFQKFPHESQQSVQTVQLIQYDRWLVRDKNIRFEERSLLFP